MSSCDLKNSTSLYKLHRKWTALEYFVEISEIAISLPIKCEQILQIRVFNINHVLIKWSMVKTKGLVIAAQEDFVNALTRSIRNLTQKCVAVALF